MFGVLHVVRDPQAPTPSVTTGRVFRIPIPRARTASTRSIREEDREFFTVNYRGELWCLAWLLMVYFRVGLPLLQANVVAHQLHAVSNYPADNRDVYP
jgi:hypothetical protein